MASFTKDKTIGQLGALLIGAAYLSGGLIGLVYTNGFGGFVDSHGTKLYGIFTINPFHSVFHIVVGIILLLVAFKGTSGMVEGSLLGIGAIYIVATITGFTYAHIPVIALISASDADNPLHLITGLTAITAALLSASQTSKTNRRLA
ncbi:MAG: hypothetical protein QOF77_19 [Solirubrobacteraceae bacterium]|jgi:hypothetical protein|nr:hypothetical protein [Solirubrobacteraceae bacterium]